MPEPTQSAGRAKPRRPRWTRITVWAGSIVLLLCIAVLATLGILLHRAEPTLRQRVIETLATRYDSRVELSSFSVSAWRGFEVIGTGLKLYPNGIEAQQPLFSVEKFAFHVNWRGPLRSPMHIHLVRITGLDIHLPPKQQRGRLPKLKSSNGQGKISIVVDRIEVNRASLVLGTDKPGKVPLDFEIGDLDLRAVGAGQPMRFRAVLINPKPIGRIDSSGSFGPFDTHDPGSTPVRGVYKFSHVDLGSIKGISGTLSSTGHYEGTLDDITVDGETNTPNFALDTAGHPMPLHTTFHAVVDGTNGDTHLDPVDATLLHSHIVARGNVVTVPGRGHDITLNVTVQPGRLEDILNLAAQTSVPVMTGNLVMHTKLHLPPGKQSVTEKMSLDGKFQITDVRFTDPKVQEKVDQLSLRSQGKPEKAKQDAAQADIASALTGNFILANRRVTVTGLRYDVPGAKIAMNGTYVLASNRVDFHGTARLKAEVSHMVTGWKSLLLKPVDPFLSKNGAGTQVPIKVTGTRKHLHFGLDFFHHGKDQKPQPPRSRQ